MHYTLFITVLRKNEISVEFSKHDFLKSFISFKYGPYPMQLLLQKLPAVTGLK